MIEKMRILFSQLVTSLIITYIMVKVGFKIADNTNVINRLYNIKLNFDSFEAIVIGLLLAYITMMLIMSVVWLMRWPKTNYAKKKKQKTAKVKKINMGVVKNPQRL